jgi:hypothetical protein
LSNNLLRCCTYEGMVISWHTMFLTSIW